MPPLIKTLFLVSIALLGCTNANSELWLKAPTDSNALEYLDSDYFDNRLSTNMSGKQAEIEVIFLTPFSSNNVPNRMDAWLTSIGNSGGEVKTVPVEGERNILGLMVSLYTVYQEVQKIILYLPAQNYNAKLLYRRNESGEAMIEKIVFTHRRKIGKGVHHSD